MNLMRTMRKFWCLTGFVAIIFTILAVRAIYIAFFYCSFWNLLSAALISIFAYWWLKRILGGSFSSPTSWKKKKCCKRDYSYTRDLDI